ncbi:GyrI-like domain-containing protein [Schaalia dentiphila]|uniref:GyrI-like domain-containing protein n=1 Tax=Schaalia dentiphila TaxID=3050224 RepID=UPI0028529870|nr:GyrI-like domain-containing protein [Schaalia sp. C24]
MAFDFKKEYKELYAPKKGPGIIEVPPVTYVAVRGSGDPNEEGGAYQQAIAVLYAISYTIKMSKKGSRQIEGYTDFVVPPLEGFWWQDAAEGIDYAHKEAFNWIAVIRLPDFVTREVFGWAVEEATAKKKIDCSIAEYLRVREGLCVQCLHVGSYDDEPATVEAMDAFAREQGYEIDLSEERRHHEVYLSDARKVAADKLKTIVRHPIKPAGEG